MSSGEEILVSIRCCAYNHEPYIRKCLEGFVMQKTDFRFQAVVHDDASTDGTAAVIREFADRYPDIIKPIYSIENQYSKRDGSLSRILNEHMCGKYIAICEGDDYWTDPYKLQKQVDYMEAHPECPMCFTYQGKYFQDTGVFENCNDGALKYFGVKEMIRSNWVGTLTSLSRASVMNEYKTRVQPYIPYFPLADWSMWLYFAKVGKIVKLPENTGVYRVLSNSASHMKDPLEQVLFLVETYRLREYFNLLLKIGRPLMRYRTYRDSIRSCRKVAKERKVSEWQLIYRTLVYIMKNPIPKPSKAFVREVSEMLDKYIIG